MTTQGTIADVIRTAGEHAPVVLRGIGQVAGLRRRGVTTVDSAQERGEQVMDVRFRRQRRQSPIALFRSLIRRLNRSTVGGVRGGFVGVHRGLLRSGAGRRRALTDSLRLL